MASSYLNGHINEEKLRNFTVEVTVLEQGKREAVQLFIEELFIV